MKTNLQKVAQATLDRIKESAGKKGARRDLLYQEGQILIINKRRFFAVLRRLFPELAGRGKAQKAREDIWTNWTRVVKTTASTIPKQRRMELGKFLASGQLKLRAEDRVFLVRDYRQINRLKGEGTLKNIVSDAFSKHMGKAANEEALSLLAGRDNVEGAQLGHAESVDGTSVGVGASTLAATRGRQVARSDMLTKEEQAQIDQVFGIYENDLQLELQEHIVLNKDGSLRIDYIPVLSWQLSLDNQEQAKLEKSSLAALQENLTLLASGEDGPLINGVGSILLYNVAGKKHPRKKVTGTAKKKVTSKKRATKRATQKITRPTTVVRDSSIPSKVADATRRTSRTSPSIATILGVMNQRIESTVIKNMNSPRLRNRTGQFAASVEVVDVSTTPQGFPSVGYTYQKFPYQTFEPGYAQGSQDRDPRKLIDTSIREIAAGMAIGRLYTRRV